MSLEIAPFSPMALVGAPVLLADELVPEPGGGKAVLLVDMGSSLAVGLEKRLRDIGWPVAVLHLHANFDDRPGRTVRKGNEWWTVRGDQTDLPEVLDAIEVAVGSVAVGLFLSTDSRALPYVEGRELLKEAFFLSKSMGPALVENGQTGFAAWVTVTPSASASDDHGTDGEAGLNADRLMGTSLVAGLHGLAATLSLEWPSVLCRAIDVDPVMPEDAALQGILDGLFAADRGLHSIRIGPKGTLKFTNVPVENHRRQSLNLGSADVVLATGGGRGITACCVRALAASYPCHYVLLGKTKLSGTVPDWFSLMESEANLKRRIATELVAEGVKPVPKEIERRFRGWKREREVEATLADLRAMGASADYIDLDLADGARLAQVIEDLRGSSGRICGLIHGAGELADRRIQDVSPEDFERVFGPKVDGLFNLLRVLPLEDLSFIALFSSLVALSGNVGQSHYGLANAVLNRAAVQLQNALPGCRVRAFDWGPWELGMVGTALRERFGAMGIRLIRPEEGAQAFVEGLERVGVFPMMTVGELPATMTLENVALSGKWTVRRSFSLERETFLWDHVIGERPVLPAACAAAFLADVARELYPGYTFRSLSDFRVLKGMTFENHSEQELLVSLEGQEAEKESKVLQAWAWSPGEGGRRIPRYKGVIGLVRKTRSLDQRVGGEDVRDLLETTASGWHGMPAGSAHEAGIRHKESFEGDRQGEEAVGHWSGAELYRSGLLFHGGSFQGLRDVWDVDERGLAATCGLPASAVQGPGTFAEAAINPFLCDSMLQSLVIWTQLTRGLPCLPAGLGRLEMVAPLCWGQAYLVRLRVREVRASAVLADVDGFDESGSLVLRVEGLEGTMSSRLAPLFLQGASINRKSSDPAIEPKEQGAHGI